jgi:hypothetical protein
MTHFPYRCPVCRSMLLIHCGSWCCAWLRCGNARCRVTTVDLDGGRMVDRDGHCEVVA